MGLVLSQEEQTLRLLVSLGSHASQGNVEAAGFERVHLVGKGDDHTIPDATNNQDSLWFPHSDVGDESFSSLFSNFSLCSRFGLQLQWVVGKHGTAKTRGGVSKHLNRGWRRIFIYTRCPTISWFFLNLNRVNSCVPVHIYDECVMRIGYVNLHLAKCNIDCDTNVHIGELWLCGEKHCPSFGQVANGGIVETVGLGGGVEAALGVHVKLTVTLTTIHWCSVKGIFALCTLNKERNKHSLVKCSKICSSLHFVQKEKKVKMNCIWKSNLCLASNEFSPMSIPVVCNSLSYHFGGYSDRRGSQCCFDRGNPYHRVHCMYLRGRYTDTWDEEKDNNPQQESHLIQAICENSSVIFEFKSYSLFTLSLQQEVATKTAFTFVPQTVVLAVHTHSILFCGTLRHPIRNLVKRQRMRLAKIRKRQNGNIQGRTLGISQKWKVLTLLGSRRKSRECSRAFLYSFLDKQTSLFPLQNSRHGRHVPPPFAEPTNRGLHFSQCFP